MIPDGREVAGRRHFSGDGAVLLAGPTASGKSALAMRLAERLGGVVVNADSMQVYDGLRLVTARPSPDDEARVPHRLYGHVEPETAYSVGAWLRDLRLLLEREHRPVILVGGTGLYFHAATRGLADVPPVPDEVRERWRDPALSLDGLAVELARRDPQASRSISPGDRQRMARAIEVHDATGRPLSDWRRDAAPPLLPNATGIVLEPPRPVLRERIARRAGAMMEEGAVEEVRALLARTLDRTLPAMRAIGVAEIGGWIEGRHDRETALERLVVSTRQYAKRQSTWFRNQMGPEWRRVASADALDATEAGGAITGAVTP